ncbi:MAG: ribonuclease HII [Alphaproteobacteria bacterium]|nr:ribonuclease HII [Alphaproteobacteria bacterium]MBQ7285399.1 ribonuclease HII [Alphaproteobacteria bacterium]
MPDFEWEDKFNTVTVGVDEAGRGPWAGPVVAGAVIIIDRKLDDFLLAGLNDSKKLSAKKREKLYDSLFAAEARGQVAIGIGQASAQEIDESNILQATFEAMRRAVAQLKLQPNCALIDGNQNPKSFPCKSYTVIKGDAKSYSIAAASIVAKVYRDRLMSNLAQKYPYYAFEKNAGYGTAAHIAGLQAHGVTPEHRKSYKPIQEFLLQKAS